MGNSNEKSPSAIIAIGLFKLIKGLLLFATAIGALSLLHRDVEQTINHWIALFRVDPDNELIHRVASKLFSITPRQLKEISAGTFFYAVLLLIEGVGLLDAKYWAEYFTVITTAALIPSGSLRIDKTLYQHRSDCPDREPAILCYLVLRIRSGPRQFGKRTYVVESRDRSAQKAFYLNDGRGS